MGLKKDQQKTQKMGVVVFLFTMFTLFYLIPTQIMVPSTVKVFYMSPAFFPQMLTGILAVLALTLVIWPGSTARVEEVEEDESGESRTEFNYQKVTITFIILLIYAFILIKFLGFLFATILVLAALMLYAGNRNYRSIALLSILIPVILVLFFSKFAYVPFPKGVIFPW